MRNHDNKKQTTKQVVNRKSIAQIWEMSNSELHDLWGKLRAKGYYPEIFGLPSIRQLREELQWTLLKEGLSLNDFQITQEGAT